MSSSDFEEAFASTDPPGGGQSLPGREPPSPAKILLWLVVAGAVLFVGAMVASDQGGIVEVADDQVAVIVNYATGELTLETQPGYQIFIPFVEQAFLFDKSPLKFVMEGDRNLDANHVAKLTVRANDGSNLWFDTIEIQYELLPDKARLVLTDSGPGEAFKANWVRAYARSVLRDEFGKFNSSEVADPTVFPLASNAAMERLNHLLNPHGVKVLRIITPRPKFDQHYEKAIEDRKVANQEVERIKQQLEQLRRERERRLAEIDARKAVEFESLKGELERQRIAAEQDRVRVEKSADAYSARVVADGQAIRATLVEEARGLEEKARKEAEGLTAKIQALEQRGEVLVRERLAQRLTEMEFRLVPYARDPAPDRIELLDERRGTGEGGER